MLWTSSTISITTNMTPHSTDSWTINFLPKTYEEQILKTGAEPQKRWLSLVLREHSSKWHVKVTFHGTLQNLSTFAKVTKRREDLRDLCDFIDFSQIKLLNNTVTELVITHNHNTAVVQSQQLPLKKPLEPLKAENEYASVAKFLQFDIREDPFRVRFPPFNNSAISSILTKDLSQIKKKRELNANVHEILVDGDQELYIYKEIDRPLYEPKDSEVLEQELRNLVRLRSTPGIVHLVAAVISENPYKTVHNHKNSDPAVLRGILLEHHPNGTLKHILDSTKTDSPWAQWALQISIAIDHLHRNDLAHMDLKPENIVISKEQNAILIDVSGIGGVTHDWLSPEMQQEIDPLSHNIKSQKQNDIWALGKLLSIMAESSHHDMEKQLLMSIALHATSENPTSRIPLREVISRLSSPIISEDVLPQNSLQSIWSGSNPPFVRSSI